jgi:apolipoprotein N-acyltransferase
MFIFPTTTTTLVHSVIGPFFSTFTSIANAVLDYGPLRQSSSVFGLAFVHFFVMLLGTTTSFIYLGLHKKRIKIVVQLFIVFVLFLFLYCNLELVAIRFYQVNISGPGGLENIPTVQASCIYGQQALNLSTQWNELWVSTDKRLASGDAFVLWSEESASIFSFSQEAALLKQGMELVRRYGFKSFLGLTYIMTILDSPGVVSVTNNFALIAPDGSVAWIYEKAFPVPIVEANVEPGDRILPKYNHSKYGTISGAICFDIEFPDYIRGKTINVIIRIILF